MNCRIYYQRSRRRQVFLTKMLMSSCGTTSTCSSRPFSVFSQFTTLCLPELYKSFFNTFIRGATSFGTEVSTSKSSHWLLASEILLVWIFSYFAAGSGSEEVWQMLAEPAGWGIKTLGLSFASSTSMLFKVECSLSIFGRFGWGGVGGIMSGLERSSLLQ